MAALKLVLWEIFLALLFLIIMIGPSPAMSWQQELDMPQLVEDRIFRHRACLLQILSNGFPLSKGSMPALLEMLDIPSTSELAERMRMMLCLCDSSGMQKAGSMIACLTTIEEMEQFATRRLGSCGVAILQPSGLGEEKEMMLKGVKLRGTASSKLSVDCEAAMVWAWLCREMEELEGRILRGRQVQWCKRGVDGKREERESEAIAWMNEKIISIGKPRQKVVHEEKTEFKNMEESIFPHNNENP